VKLLKVKTARFAQVVEKAGKPEVSRSGKSRRKIDIYNRRSKTTV